MSSPLWYPSPENQERSNLNHFMRRVNPDFKNYWDLYEWSVERIPEFWAEVWRFTGMRYSKKYKTVLDDPNKMPNSGWFPGVRLNFAENLLRFDNDQTAIIAKTEENPAYHLSYSELQQEVRHIHNILKHLNLSTGDRVVGYMPNVPETIYAMLGATSLGGIWSGCSPDFGTEAVIERFGQIEPRFLFMTDSYVMKSKKIDLLDRAKSILESIPSLEKIIVMPYKTSKNDNTESNLSLASSKITYIHQLTDDTTSIDSPIEYEQLPFDHPVYIMFSSGTTGKPKCIAQGVGVLLNHLKELMLHTDLKKDERIFYFTTCSWMMWNWLVSSLAVGSSVVLYDGNPLPSKKDSLWQFTQDEKIHIFGTSARYLSLMARKNLDIGTRYDLSSLRTILSTGSPLSEENFEYVYSHIKKDVQLSSISGGTDLNGCFALGNPLLPVYSGELQCPGLGMKVEIFDEEGQSITNKKGELVCTKAFPSMPLFFWNDQNQKKYQSAYFERYQGVWHHGDYALLTPHRGFIFHGRSDATLNPGGVRLGSSEIYREIEKFSDITDSLVVEQEWKGTGRIILFVLMQEGKQLTSHLKKELSKSFGQNISPWHVPKKIIQVNDIPYTYNMKKVELAVKKTIHGEDVTNKDVLMNPDSLEQFRNIEELGRN